MTRQDFTQIPRTPAPTSRRAECNTAGDFFAESLRKSPGKKHSTETIKKFLIEFIYLINKRYDGHWYVKDPMRGSGFREISIYFQCVDKILKLACDKAGLSEHDLREAIGPDLTVFVDPGCVSYRRGCTFGNCGDVIEITKKYEVNPLKLTPVKPNAVLGSSAEEPMGSSYSPLLKSTSASPVSTDSGLGSPARLCSPTLSCSPEPSYGLYKDSTLNFGSGRTWLMAQNCMPIAV